MVLIISICQIVRMTGSQELVKRSMANNQVKPQVVVRRHHFQRISSGGTWVSLTGKPI